ncbi:MAG: hypothetical protein ACRC3Z_09870 [Phocaeicola sp.]
MKRLKHIILSLGLLTLFFAYEVGLTMFTHVHIVNGLLIVHSHPASDSHAHSLGQLITIACLESIETEEAKPTPILLPYKVLLYEIKELPFFEFQQETPHYSYSLRGPPTYF